jgi:hypothetical protein
LQLQSEVSQEVVVTNAPFAPVFSFLQPLLLPTVLAGLLFGFALVAVEWRRKPTLQVSSTLQRVPVFLSAAVAVVALSVLVTTEIRRAPNFNPWGLVVFSLLLLMGAPVVFWRSRWQLAAVGVATVAIALMAFITGFSIGVLFVPLVLAMVLVCFSHLRRLA